MNKLFGAIALTALLSPLAFAQDSAQHGGEKADGSMGMHDQRMASMHQHMQKMHVLMEKIRTEQDPEKRQQLMEQHMDAMQTGMRRMRESMSTPSRSENGNQGMHESMNMEACMRMMDERGAMMQKMMDQMKEHQTQEKKMRRHVPGK